MEPIRIALMGAPTAGKSDIAQRVARALNRDNQGKWKVIDGYIDRLSQRTGTQFGYQAGYLQNFQILCERLTLEQEAHLKEYNTITVGTIYDTTTYAALINIVPSDDEQLMLLQAQTASMLLGTLCVLESSLAYHHLFYVPWQNRENEHSYDAVINAKLSEVFSGFGREATTLTGTRKQQVKDALKVTRYIRDEFIPKLESPMDDG